MMRIVTATLLARRAERLSLALTGDHPREDHSSPQLAFTGILAAPWRATVAGRPPRARGRWFTGRGTSPDSALEDLVAQLVAECAVRDVDARRVLRAADLAD